MGNTILDNMNHKLEYKIGQVVYLRTDKDQNAKIVTSITLHPCNSVSYCLNENGIESSHYGFEITDTRDIIGYSLN
jgi:hypothetical protein